MPEELTENGFMEYVAKRIKECAKDGLKFDQIHDAMDAFSPEWNILSEEDRLAYKENAKHEIRQKVAKDKTESRFLNVPQASTSSSVSNANSAVSSTVIIESTELTMGDDGGPNSIVDIPNSIVDIPSEMIKEIDSVDDNNMELLSSSDIIISSGNTTTTTTQIVTDTNELSSNEYSNPINQIHSFLSSEIPKENERTKKEESNEQKHQQENDNNDDEEDEPPLLSPNLPENPDNNNTSSSVISSTTNDPVSTSSGVGVSSTLLGPKPPTFDTQLKRGQVKIIRTGDVMYVMKVDLDGKQSIESYSRPVKTKYKSKASSSSPSSSIKPVAKKRKIGTSPFKSQRVEGEAALTTISRYCFPSYHDAQLQQLTLADILQKSKQVVGKILDSRTDHGIAEHHIQFITNKFLVSDVGNITMKDWEVLRDIFDGRQQWKVNQMRNVRLTQRRSNNNNTNHNNNNAKKVIVSEVSYPPSTCLKTLPRRTAKDRKEDMKNYKSFVDLGSRLDFTLLQKKRGTRNCFIVPPPKVQILLQRSSFYGHLATKQGKGFTRKYLAKKSTSSFGNGMTSTAAAATVTKKKYAGKSKNKIKNLVPIQMMRKKVCKNNKTSKSRSLKQIKNSTDATTTTFSSSSLTTTTKQEPSALEKLNPRRDKPMAKIRSQVRKVDRMAKLNGDSFHNAALALSRTSGLNRPPIRTYGIANHFQESASSSSTTTTSITNATTTTTTGPTPSMSNLNTIFSSSSSASSKETDLDLGLEGVCFDPEVNELTNSVMVSAADLEYLDGLDKDSVDLNFSTGTDTITTNSLVAALHAGINNSSITTTSSIGTEPSISSPAITPISTTVILPSPSCFTTTSTTTTTDSTMNSTITTSSGNSNNNNNPIISPPSTITIDVIGNLTFSTCSNTSTTTINSTCTSSSSSSTTSSLIPLKLDNNISSTGSTTSNTDFNFDDIDNRLLEALNAFGAEIGDEENSNSKNEMLLEMTPAQNKAFESFENQLIADFQQDELSSASNSSNNNPMNTNTKIHNNQVSNKKLNIEEIPGRSATTSQQSSPSMNFSVTDNDNPHSSEMYKDNSISTQHKPITHLKGEEKRKELAPNASISYNSLAINNFDINTLHQSENLESQKLPNKVESNTNRTTTTTSINKNIGNFVQLNSRDSITPTSLENNTEQLESKTTTMTNSTVSNFGNSKRPTRATLPTKLESPVKESSSSSSSSSPVTPNKKTAALKCTLTGSYWQTPGANTTTTPANRPRREKAGALMATKLGLKNREARKLAAQEKAKERKSKLSSVPSSVSQKRAHRVISGGSSVVDKDWNGKFTNKRPYEEPITQDGMIISQKTALKCIVSIPNKFVPTPHENFLEQFVDLFEESELFELYKVFNRIEKGKTSKYFQKKQYEDFKKSDIYIKKFYKTRNQRKLDSPVLSSQSKVVSGSSTASSPSCSPPVLTPITTTTITTSTTPAKSKTTISVTSLPTKSKTATIVTSLPTKSKTATVVTSLPTKSKTATIVTPLPTKIIPTVTTKPIVTCSPSSTNITTTPTIPTATTTTSSTSETCTLKTEDKEQSKVPVIENIETELSNDIPIPEVEISTLKSISIDSSLEVQSQSQLPEQKEQQTETEVTVKDETDESIVPVPKPKSSFHRKRYEDDEKTEYVKVGTSEIVSNGVTYFVDHVNYKMEKDVIIEYDDYDFKPEVTKDLTIKTETDTDVDSTKDKEKEDSLTTATTTTKSKSSDSKTSCTLPYCLLGCVCDSLKNDRGPREHCGKLKCMIDCTCGQGSTTDDADIRSRLRPRVSMLNWSSRLNYPEAYFHEREMLGKMNGSYGESYNPYARVRRPIIPPKRNSDFVFHCPTKKSRLEQAKALGRQGPGRATSYNRFRLNQRHFSNIKNENAQGKQSKDATRSRLNSDSRGIRKVGLDKITKPVIQRAVQIQRNVAHRTHRTLKPTTQQMSRSQEMARNRSIQGNGDLIPPELMAQFIPFMEIHVPPPRNKILLLSSDSESSDDENDDDEHEVKYVPQRFHRIPDPVSTVENKEQDVFLPVIPVIVSYTSKQDGFSEVIYPNSDDTTRV